MHTTNPQSNTSPDASVSRKSQSMTCQTMSSREIAKLTGKEHFHVKRDIEKLLKELSEDASKFGCIYTDRQNRSQTEYCLDRDHTDCLLTGYSAPLRMKVIKRWKELEAAQPKAKDVAWLEARQVGKQMFKGLHDYIATLDGSDNQKRWAHENATNRIYKALTGGIVGSAKSLRKLYGIEHGTPRDKMSHHALAQISLAERRIYEESQRKGLETVPQFNEVVDGICERLLTGMGALLIEDIPGSVIGRIAPPASLVRRTVVTEEYSRGIQ
jgi:phage regulator Rha-like protein